MICDLKFTTPRYAFSTSVSTICVPTIEDVEMMKKEKVCDQCYEMFYYTNKDKWNKGWRPKLKSEDNYPTSLCFNDLDTGLCK